MSQDSELVGAYVQEGSETAFRALVTRHANLVYATAFRQVGDSGIAEEITQNVFIELARKAPRLAGIETLAGWLHRTAVFQSRTRIRSELRRRSREQTAAALEAIERETDPSLDILVPLVDEALLHLREGDRIALVLRFFENQSLREVGSALGVDEDAARKRVSRALDKVISFFRQRGFTIPAGIGAAGLLTGSVQAAPVGLVAVTASHAAAAGQTVSGIPLLLFHLMNIGTKKIVIGCLALAAVPLFWQEHLGARLEAELTTLTGQLATAERQLQELNRETGAVHESISRALATTEKAQGQLATLNAQRIGKMEAPVYQWDDNSPYMRVPNHFLEELPPTVTYRNDKIELDTVALEFLQMSEAEIEQVQAALQAFSNAQQDALARNLRRVEPTEFELYSRSAEQVRAFEVPAMAKDIEALRQTLFGQLQHILGKERFPRFRDTLSSWMPIDNADTGLARGRTVIPVAHRVVFFKPANDSILHGAPALNVNWSVIDGGDLSGHLPLEEIPRAFAAELQDWMELSRLQSLGKSLP